MRKGSYNGTDSDKIANRTMTVASNFKCKELRFILQFRICKDLIPSQDKFHKEIINKL